MFCYRSEKKEKWKRNKRKEKKNPSIIGIDRLRCEHCKEHEHNDEYDDEPHDPEKECRQSWNDTALEADPERRNNDLEQDQDWRNEEDRHVEVTYCRIVRVSQPLIQVTHNEDAQVSRNEDE